MIHFAHPVTEIKMLNMTYQHIALCIEYSFQIDLLKVLYHSCYIPPTNGYLKTSKILNAITEHQGDIVLRLKMSWDKIWYSSDRQSVHWRVCPVQQILIHADSSQISSNLDELVKPTGENQEKKLSCVFLTLAVLLLGI